MRIDITKTTVERAMALGKKLNQQKVASAAIEMTGDIVVLSVDGCEI
jgi:hypothetical protein